MLIQLYDFYYLRKRNVRNSSKISEEEETTPPKEEVQNPRKEFKVPKIDITPKTKNKDALKGEVSSPAIDQQKQIKRAD